LSYDDYRHRRDDAVKSIWYLLAAMMVTVSVAALTTPKAAAGSAASPPVFPSCAWGGDWGEALNADTILANPALNASEPDVNADYWALVYIVEPGEKITLSGPFPHARYMSIESYTPTTSMFSLNGVSPVLTDYQIVPDRGGVNPWQHNAKSAWSHGMPLGRYTVTLSSDPEPGEANTIPIAPAGTAPGSYGFLQWRVYLQPGSVWSIPLPKVTITEDGISKHIPTCSREQQTFPTLPGMPLSTTAISRAASAAIAPTAPTASSSGSGQIVAPFFQPIPGVDNNLDSGYLAAGLDPATNGDVLVIRAKAPTHASGHFAQPWPSPGVDLRYWSFCDFLYTGEFPTVVNHLPNGQVDFGCRYDDQIKLTHGYYTIVVGTEAQRAAIERIPGATFLPLSSANPTETHVIYLRNMLVNPSFTEAVQDTPRGPLADATTIAAEDQQIMGVYYPQTAFYSIPALAKWAATGYAAQP
jgi:hypothetical protein